MEVAMKIILWDVTPYNLVELHCIEGNLLPRSSVLIYTDDGVVSFLWNFGRLVPDYTKLHLGLYQYLLVNVFIAVVLPNSK
jgi:hypothetical protein